jgi:hypothetical protein
MTIDLRPLGQVRSMYLYTENEPGVTTRATGPGCDFGVNTQLIVSSFTYQGARAKSKTTPKMYVQNAHPAFLQKLKDRSA